MCEGNMSYNNIRSNTITSRKPVLVERGVCGAVSNNAVWKVIRVREIYASYFSAKGAVHWPLIYTRFFEKHIKKVLLRTNHIKLKSVFSSSCYLFLHSLIQK